MRAILSVALLTLVLDLAWSQPPTRSAGSLCRDRTAVDHYAAALERGMKAAPHRVFGKAFPEEAPWQPVGEDFEGVVATVYFEGSRPVVVTFGVSSESGDWAQDLTYYYRSDGTLAKKVDILNTFNGSALVTKTTHFNCSGRVIQRRVQHLDLVTKREKAPSEAFVDEPSPEYLRVRQLPFFHLLGTRP